MRHQTTTHRVTSTGLSPGELCHRLGPTQMGMSILYAGAPEPRRVRRSRHHWLRGR